MFITNERILSREKKRIVGSHAKRNEHIKEKWHMWTVFSRIDRQNIIAYSQNIILILKLIDINLDLFWKAMHKLMV